MCAHHSRARVDHGRYVLATTIALVIVAIGLIALIREYTTLRAATAGADLADTVSLLLRVAPWEGSDVRLEYSGGRRTTLPDTTADSGR